MIWKAGIFAIVLVLAGSSGAFAVPPTLPTDQPIFIQYVNAEQFSLTNSISSPTSSGEGNWGIVQVTSLTQGTALNPQGSDIQGGGTPVSLAGGQILGIFYDIHIVDGNHATGGQLDLYWWEGVAAQNVGTELSSGANLAKRTAQDQYTGFTCATGNTANCTLLAHLTFEEGANPGDTSTTIFSPVQPGTGDGTSKSYLSVDTSVQGAWTGILDSNFFTLDPCDNPVGHVYVALENCPTTGSPIAGSGGVSFPAAQDVRLDNNFTRGGALAWDQTGGIIGLRSNDPARAFVISVPAPGTLVLLGLGLLSLGASRFRRRR